MSYLRDMKEGAERESESVVDEFVEREFSASSKGRVAATHGPLPIVVGITGHRDIRAEDIPRLEAIIRSEFTRLRAAYPSTSFVVLSALAEGADRLGARLALEAGLRLVVPLPMEQPLYELEFEGDSLKEFRTLLSRAEHHFSLPAIAGVTSDELRYHGAARDRHYAQLGAYLATQSEVLIALWDGVTEHLTGGTAHIVHYKLYGVPRSHNPLDAPDTGPVMHIITPRRSRPEIDRALTLHRIYPSGFAPTPEANDTVAERAYEVIYKRIDAFNADALRFASALNDEREESKSGLLPASEQVTLPAMLREVLEFYSIADVLSQRFQRRTLVTLRLLLSCVFLAAACYDVYSHLMDESAFIASYLVMFTFSFLCYYWAARKGYHTKYLDYRALAEGLRVQFYWGLAGVNASVADHYMRKQKSELDWIRNGIRSSTTETCENASVQKLEISRRNLELVQQHWVEAQARYFGNAAHRDHARLHRNEKWISWMFALALLLAGVQLALQKRSEAVLMGIGLLPVLAALLHTYVQKNALSEQTKQYDRMSVLFHRAKQRLASLINARFTDDRQIIADPGALSAARSFLEALGKEALEENGEWILTHRDRPLEVPKGA